MDPERAPRVSVIITNWNYSNYLRAAIDSALGQTQTLHELIVVDDGSQDGSRAILASYGDRIVTVLQENQGQAAAFNAGFARSTGDIIIFLDADDVLRPEAAETITAVWHPALAAVCYRMELIDRSGASRGIYPVAPTAHDQRPHLVETGDFNFLPTSANAFSRHVVERACPLPTTRWKISADAYLLRIAALSGGILPLRQILASYRIHESNNYHRIGAPELWRHRRDRRDAADLASYFAEGAHLWGDDPARLGVERLLLRMAAVRGRATLAQLGQRPSGVGTELRRLSRDLVGTGAPLFPRLGMALAAFLVSLGIWRQRTVLSWLRFPEGRPVLVRGTLAALGRRSLLRYRQAARASRWRTPLPLDRELEPHLDLRAEQALGVGWSITDGAPPQSSGRRVELSLMLPPTPAPLQAEIGLSVHPASFDREVFVEASIAGEVMVRAVGARETTTLVVPMAANSAAFGAEVTIDLTLRGRRGRDRWSLRRLFSMPATVTLERLALRTVRPAQDGAPIEEGRARAFADFVDGTDGSWEIASDGSATLLSSTGKISLTSAPSGTAFLAAITIPDDQPKGWMRIVIGDAEAFTGRWGESRELRFRMPWMSDGGFAAGELTFAFAPEDVLDDGRPSVATIAFRAQRDDAVLPVNPGQQLTFRANAESSRALGPEWVVDDRVGATLAVGRGTIELLLPQGMTDASLELDVEPVLPAPEDHRHLLMISAGESVLGRVVLAGEATLPLALPADLLSGRSLRLTVVSLFAEVEDEQGNPAEAPMRPAPVSLRALRVSGQRVGPAVRLDVRRPAPGSIEGLLGDAAQIIARTEPDVEALAAIRQNLTQLIGSVDQRALLSLLSSQDVLIALMRINNALAPLAQAGEAMTGSPAAPPADVDRFRAILIAMMAGPASALPWLADLTTIPAPLLWHPGAFGAYLGRDPKLPLGDAGEAYEQFIAALILSVDTLIASDPEDSPRRALAVEVLRHLWPQRLLFLPGAHKAPILALGRAIERMLTLDGYCLPWAIPPRAPGPRLRIGILLRHLRQTPETAIAAAMLEALDPARFEPVLIALSSADDPLDLCASERFACLRLDRLDVGEAVDAIRRLGLDIFVAGAFFNMFEPLTSIVAHRLARVQLATTAVFPVTTGLASFDGMLSSDAIEAPDGTDDYVEPLVTIPGPIQAFARRIRPASDPAATPLLRRSRLGLPADGFLMASGAMMQKIDAALMTAWARILAAVPGSTLVLYPYAANWNVDFSIAAFERWTASVLTAHRVAAHRFVFLRGLTAAEVRATLRAVDLYLDSFPYAGAATVTEALEEGLPVVALQADRQRGRQGAGWLLAYGLEDDIATTVDAYVSRAVALATDPDLLRGRRDLIAKRNDAGAPHLDLATYGKALSKLLIDVAAAHGVTINPTAPVATVAPSGPPRYVFHPLPGAAGATVIETLSEWFDAITDAAPPETETPGERLITIVRDPLELALSRYFRDHSRRAYDPTFEPRTLRDHLRDPASDYAHHFGYTPDTWREVLDRYWFIGTVERLNESIDYLADALGALPSELPHLNRTARPLKPNADDIDVFVRQHALDYEVYNAIRRRLATQLSKRR